MSLPAGLGDAVGAALRVLDVRRLVLGIHDPSFPAPARGDLGRGAPASEAGAALLRFVRELGFDGLQLGPQGQTPEWSPSPYDGTHFSRNVLSIDPWALAGPADGWPPLVDPSTVEAAVARRPPGADLRVPYDFVWRAQGELLGRAYERFQSRRSDPQMAGFVATLEAFGARHAAWLERDGLYQVLRRLHGGQPFFRWPDVEGAPPDRRLYAPRRGEEEACRARLRELRARHEPELAFHRFTQLLAHLEHERLRAAARREGLRLYGDLQIGYGETDAWGEAACFLPGYRLGAPPSRTNPEGQPWDYPVFHPDRVREADGTPGPVLRAQNARIAKLHREFDALRIDHPHGLVCPWVYRADMPDPHAAVRGGARLLASPDLPDHPELARFAIPSRAQLDPDPATPRHADHWVATLRPDQLDRYDALFGALVRGVRERDGDGGELVCEVLSTLPRPLALLLERHGLGRFRVTQKADLSDAADVYRSENARPEDWVMIGNHDTAPLWTLLDRWREEGSLPARARHLAERLAPDTGARGAFAARLEADPGLLAQAGFAELFANPARNVFVFFSDAFGIDQVYNRPGTVSPDNWSLRLPPDYPDAYAERLRGDRALNLPAALGLALRARGRDSRDALVRRLDALAADLRAPSGP